MGSPVLESRTTPRKTWARLKREERSNKRLRGYLMQLVWKNIDLIFEGAKVGKIFSCSRPPEAFSDLINIS
jgi:hypothetical protein